MSEERIHDLIIVGAGPGGLTAGIYAKRAALDALLIEKGVAGGQMNLTQDVENWPGTRKTTGADLTQTFWEHALSYGLEVLNAEVLAVEPGLDFHTVRLADGGVRRALAVILGTGGSPRKLGMPGEKEFYGRGVSYCAVCDGFFFRGKSVVVIGGGDSACEESLYLAKLCNKVHIVHRRDAFRASMILRKRVLSEPRITVSWNTVVTSVLGDKMGVNSVVLRNLTTGQEEVTPTDGVFVFIGFQPNNVLVPAGTRMDADGFVITDGKCETNIPGVFVIGDLRQKYAKQIVTAAGDGCTAALAAAHFVENRRALRTGDPGAGELCPA